MPTILELFRGSNKDITPNIPDETPLRKIFPNSPQDKAVHSSQINLVKQELSGIRIKSKVELNNPLIYGNEAIRIATRSTSSVEKMKQATGGSAASGGLIGKALGAITGGGFGKFLFGGKVTSLNQARDGINSRIGIPVNAIPTYVNNTGELQAGIEPDTMITLSKIRNDAKGTIVGTFLKNTGGGNPKTIGKQILGQGISLVKDKLRKALFGNPNTLGANTAGATDKWEYSSKLPYSKQIDNVKFNSKSVSKIDKGATDITKKVTQLQLDAKKKLGEASANATASLKQKLKGSASPTALDELLEKKDNERLENDRPYNKKYSSYVTSNSTKTNLKIPTTESNDVDKKVIELREDAKKKLGESSKNSTDLLKKKLKGTESKPEIDKAVEAKTKTTTATPTTYSGKLGDYTNEKVSERIDLSLVSPVYGIDRRKTKGVFGTSPYAFKDVKNNTGAVMPNDPTRPYSGIVGGTKIGTLETKYGITSNKGDLINSSYGVGGTPLGYLPDGDKKDLITFAIAGVNDKQKVYFRTLVTGLSETVSPTWDSAKFVGNPYSYYTYGGVERSVSLQLKMYCMNSSELASMWQRIQFLTSKAYPTIDKSNLVNPPFIEFTLGNIYQNKTAFINSLSYTIPDDGVWETGMDGMQLPKIVEVQFEFKFVENIGVEHKLYGTAISKEAVKTINNKRAQQSGTTTTVNQQPKTGGTAATTNNGGKATASQVVQPTTPPPPINNVGAPQTEAPKPQSKSGGMLGVDSTPKSLNTGKPAETPKQSNDPAMLTSIAMSSQTKEREDKEKALKKYDSYPEWVRSIFAYHETGGRKLNEIKKLNETAFYFEWVDEDDDTYEQVAHAKLNEDGTFQNNNISSYSRWCTKFNDGKDPLNKYFHNKDGKIASKTEMATANTPKSSNQLGF
jgi:hypothetical protein